MKKSDRDKLFNKYGGKCAYCGCELKKGWHADHIEPVIKLGGVAKYPERDTVKNMNPACPSCNVQKNSFTLEQFRNNIQYFITSLNQYSTQYKFAKKYGLVNETNIEVKFYYEENKEKKPLKKFKPNLDFGGVE